MRILAGLFLLVVAIYIPISLFSTLPPFGSWNKYTYNYDVVIPQEGQLADAIARREIVVDNQTIVRSDYPLVRAEEIGLRFRDERVSPAKNPWYVPTVYLSAAAFLGALILLLKR